ncbi:hypothetical protein J31TS4_17100 [Paenibacillus sp. J31TS4]|uniref:GNAT family N-acetyltransferase n=1 Tax=Paenibacillus sp. J31TS4 TaxID=2807195 RepID=UPI001B0D522B|nr:GNAT family N-acetyltransferase [Paenibacillus sp. J31TS4]GIP38430.1 hypothetical protein J31TS4_17100 [Paenibacillus sp. J31TS4]
MTQTDLRYERFRNEEYAAVRELVSGDAEAGEDLLRTLAQYPDLFVTAYNDDKLVAIAQMSKPGVVSYLTVFVVVPFRRQGIGTAVVKHAEAVLREGGTQTVRSSFVTGHPAAHAFARKLGYDDYFSSAYMERTGDPFPPMELPARPYTDEDYLESQAMYAQAFHEMRVRVGSFPDSVVAHPSETERRAWREDAADHFVCERNGEIVAYSHLSGNEISSVSVRPDVQGQGIGRKFVMYLCNELYRRGHTTVSLWCVVGNPARHLYDSLGFTEGYSKQYMRKRL